MKGSTALQIVAGMKPRNEHTKRATRKTVLERCIEINEEIRRERELKRKLLASIILDGVIEP